MGYIKIKNESCHFEVFTSEYTDGSCKWCGKTIKAGNEHFYSITLGLGDEYCSLSHVKQTFKAEKGL